MSKELWERVEVDEEEGSGIDWHSFGETDPRYFNFLSEQNHARTRSVEIESMDNVEHLAMKYTLEANTKEGCW